MLIVIEGLDGAGKSTQVARLKEYLQARTGSLKYIHFPRYDAPVYGDLISRFLRGDFGNNSQVHPNLVALLFAEDRHGAASQIRQALDNGFVVLLDRYVYSNIAYQCAKLSDSAARKNLRDWIFKTEYEDFGIPKPDLNIYLNVPISFVKNQLESHRLGADRDYLKGKGDIHEADIRFQEEVRKIYLEQCNLDQEFIPLECSDDNGGMLPADAIFEKLKKLVEDNLK